MIVIPAIDLMGGCAVRLHKGKRDQATTYHKRPWELAASFRDAGAQRLHLVDLDAAFDGESTNAEVIQKIVEQAEIPVELGGGLRSLQQVQRVFSWGVEFAVLGTAAVKDPEFAQELCKRYPKRVVVAVDANDGLVATHGWVEQSTISAVELSLRAQGWGAAAILYTDISRDGTKSGPNVIETANLQQALGSDTPVIASGGIGTLEHIRQLRDAEIAMTVVGRALYDGVFDVSAALAAGQGSF